MMDQPQYLTREGMVDLEKKLKNLIEVRRPQVAERLREAMDEGGDLTQNAEYEDAKKEQSFVEGEIARIETVLRYAQVIEDAGSGDEVRAGSKVTVVEKGQKEKEVYHLVGSAEANPREGKISIESPLGMALLGAKVKDKVKVKAPDGDFVYVIKSID